MKRIEYNVSSGKSIDMKHYITSASVILIISALFLILGIKKISDTNTNLREKVDRKRFYGNEQNKITDEGRIFNERIEEIKKKWNYRVTFANTVINAKVFPFTERLNYFEEILPDMVQLNEIVLDSGVKGSVSLMASSYSTEKLYELYRKLIAHDLVIVSESEKNGIYRSRMKVTLK